MVAHATMRISAILLKTFFSSQTPYRQKCPTTSNSDVRLSCSNQECWRNRPCVASPRAAALLWGNGALIRQRVTEYHNAPPGLTAKYRRKSSIFSLRHLPSLRPALIPAGLRAVFNVYRCISCPFGSNRRRGIPIFGQNLSGFVPFWANSSANHAAAW